MEVTTIVSVLDADSRDEAEGPLLPEEEAHSDMASFQPTDSDVPSFLEDCNRVTAPCIFVYRYFDPFGSIYNIESPIYPYELLSRIFLISAYCNQFFALS